MPINAKTKELLDEILASDFPKKELKRIENAILTRSWVPDEAVFLDCQYYLISVKLSEKQEPVAVYLWGLIAFYQKNYEEAEKTFKTISYESPIYDLVGQKFRKIAEHLMGDAHKKLYRRATQNQPQYYQDALESMKSLSVLADTQKNVVELYKLACSEQYTKARQMLWYIAEGWHAKNENEEEKIKLYQFLGEYGGLGFSPLVRIFQIADELYRDPEKTERALALYEFASECGYKDATARLVEVADAYWANPATRNKSIKLYKVAARHGSQRAVEDLVYLADKYRTSTERDEKIEQIIDLYTIASEQGRKEAREKLMEVADEFFDSSETKPKAITLYKVAASHGSSLAIERLLGIADWNRKAENKGRLSEHDILQLYKFVIDNGRFKKIGIEKFIEIADFCCQYYLKQLEVDDNRALLHDILNIYKKLSRKGNPVATEKLWEYAQFFNEKAKTARAEASMGEYEQSAAESLNLIKFIGTGVDHFSVIAMDNLMSLAQSDADSDRYEGATDLCEFILVNANKKYSDELSTVFERALRLLLAIAQSYQAQAESMIEDAVQLYKMVVSHSHCPEIRKIAAEKLLIIAATYHQKIGEDLRFLDDAVCLYQWVATSPDSEESLSALTTLFHMGKQYYSVQMYEEAAQFFQFIIVHENKKLNALERQYLFLCLHTIAKDFSEGKPEKLKKAEKLYSILALHEEGSKAKNTLIGVVALYRSLKNNKKAESIEQFITSLNSERAGVEVPSTYSSIKKQKVTFFARAPVAVVHAVNEEKLTLEDNEKDLLPASLKLF